MHVLGHSFSQKRKSSKRPRDLHIRKVSFSGSSLSSGCSFSSSSSTSTFTPRTGYASSTRVDSAIGLDPLNLHPTFQAPPRLHERPLIRNEDPRWYGEVSFFEDDSDNDESEDLTEAEDDEDYSVKEPATKTQPEMELPPHASPMDHSEERCPPQDYFLSQLSKRPPMPRSRWSESTVHTLDTMATPGLAAEGDENVPNFSYKRNTLPKRPAMKQGDSIENFIKRGGWKRRGIVFHNEDMNEENECDGVLTG